MRLFVVALLISLVFSSDKKTLKLNNKKGVIADKTPNVIEGEIIVHVDQCKGHKTDLPKSTALLRLMDKGFTESKHFSIVYKDKSDTAEDDFEFMIALKKLPKNIQQLKEDALKNKIKKMMESVLKGSEACGDGLKVTGLILAHSETIPSRPSKRPGALERAVLNKMKNKKKDDETEVGYWYDGYGYYYYNYYQGSDYYYEEETEPEPEAEAVIVNDAVQTFHVPAAKDMSTDCGAIRNQREIGACLAFAVDAIFSYYELRDRGNVKVFSPKFFYYHRDVKGRSDDPGGMLESEVIGMISTTGTVEESMYPYVDVSEFEGPSHIPNNVKKAGRKYAKNYKGVKWQCEESNKFKYKTFVRHIKKVLALYGPILLNVMVHNHSECDMWNSRGTGLGGGHAMTIVGYDSDSVTIRNSWDNDWCNNGYTDMSWIDFWERSDTYCYFEKLPKGMTKVPEFTFEEEDLPDTNCGKINWGKDNKCGPKNDGGVCTELNEQCNNSGVCKTKELKNNKNSAFNYPGQCEVGCDGILGSGKVKDDCGKCGGDGSTCANQFMYTMEYFTDKKCKKSTGDAPASQGYNLGECMVELNEKMTCNDDGTITQKIYKDMTKMAVNAAPCDESLLEQTWVITAGDCVEMSDGTFMKEVFGDCRQHPVASEVEVSALLETETTSTAVVLCVLLTIVAVLYISFTKATSKNDSDYLTLVESEI